MNINEPHTGAGLTLPFHNKNKSQAPVGTKAYRLPFSKRIPENIRNHLVACLGEFFGTTLFLLFALSGTQVANNIPSTTVGNGTTVAPSAAGSNPSQLLYISLCFGFSLAVNAWVFFRISGGLFNPAVTLGMCLVGALPYFRGMLLAIVQIVGGITASAIVSGLFPGELNVRTSLGGGTSITQGVFIEMFLTFQLVFTIFMLAAEKHRGTFIAPVGIGLSLFVAELTGVYFTGGSCNPARSFGPSVVIGKFHSYHWIYWVGPILGSLLASALYKVMKVLEYETANPDQDGEAFLDEENRYSRSQVNLPDDGRPSTSGGRRSGQYLRSQPQTRDGNHLAAEAYSPTRAGHVTEVEASNSRVKDVGPTMAPADRAFSGLAPEGMNNSAIGGR